MEGTTKGAHDYNLAIVSTLLCKLDDIWEELAFINANDIVLFPLVTQASKGGDCSSIPRVAIVSSDLTLVAVPLVCLEFNGEDAFAGYLMLANSTEHLCRLASKHTADN